MLSTSLLGRDCSETETHEATVLDGATSTPAIVVLAAPSSDSNGGSAAPQEQTDSIVQSEAGGFVIDAHTRLPGVFIARGRVDVIATRNLIPGISVYEEQRILGESGTEGKVEYRVWDPSCCKLAAAIMCHIGDVYTRPGSRVLCLAGGSATVSHCSDLVGPAGLVYAVELSHGSGRDLISVATRRHNIIPIVEDAHHPIKYRFLVGTVDVVFADLAEPDQAQIVSLNSKSFLKSGGHAVISINANRIDSTVAAELVFASEIKKLQELHFEQIEYMRLEPYQPEHAVVVARFVPVSNAK